MCGIGRAAAIPANEQFVSATQTFFNQIGGLFYLRVKIAKRLQSLARGVNRFVELNTMRHGYQACLERWPLIQLFSA
jgi:hypothetical protein